MFDIMVANINDTRLMILKVGIRILQRIPATKKTINVPKHVKIQSKLSVHRHQEWKRFDRSNDQSWTRLRDPIVMNKNDSPFRFSLLLENFCDVDIASRSEVRFCLETDNGPAESESIWLKQ